MGTTSSFLPVPPEDLEVLETTTNFTRGEIEYLYTRFRELIESGGRKKYIVKTDFGYPPFTLNMLILNEMFGTKYRIDFVEFSKFLHLFKVLDQKASKVERETSKKTKLRLLFSMYDIDKDGDISKHDLLDVVHRLFSRYATMRTMVKIVNVVMMEMDLSNVARISFDDFCKALETFDMEHLAIKFPTL